MDKMLSYKNLPLTLMMLLVPTDLIWAVSYLK